MQGVNGATVSQNTVGNFSATEGENDTGIWLATGTANATVSGNTVNNLGMTLTTAFAPFGIRESSGLAASGNNFDGNTVTNLTTTGGTGLRGIAVQGGGSDGAAQQGPGRHQQQHRRPSVPSASIVPSPGLNDAVIKNNFISDVNHNMTGGAAFGPDFGVIGIRLGAGTGHKVYYNSVNLFGPHTGTATTQPALGRRSRSAPRPRPASTCATTSSPTTSPAAPRRSRTCSVYLPSGGTAAMNLTWNNNAYFFGTDAARQGVGQAGTTAGVNFFTTLAGARRLHQHAVGRRDERQRVVRLDRRRAVHDRHRPAPAAATPVAVAAGGVPIAGVTTDIDNEHALADGAEHRRRRAAGRPRRSPRPTASPRRLRAAAPPTPSPPRTPGPAAPPAR